MNTTGEIYDMGFDSETRMLCFRQITTEPDDDFNFELKLSKLLTIFARFIHFLVTVTNCWSLDTINIDEMLPTFMENGEILKDPFDFLKKLCNDIWGDDKINSPTNHHRIIPSSPSMKSTHTNLIRKVIQDNLIKDISSPKATVDEESRGLEDLDCSTEYFIMSRVFDQLLKSAGSMGGVNILPSSQKWTFFKTEEDIITTLRIQDVPNEGKVSLEGTEFSTRTKKEKTTSNSEIYWGNKISFLDKMILKKKKENHKHHQSDIVNPIIEEEYNETIVDEKMPVDTLDAKRQQSEAELDKRFPYETEEMIASKESSQPLDQKFSTPINSIKQRDERSPKSTDSPKNSSYFITPKSHYTGNNNLDATPTYSRQYRDKSPESTPKSDYNGGNTQFPFEHELDMVEGLTLNEYSCHIETIIDNIRKWFPNIFKQEQEEKQPPPQKVNPPISLLEKMDTEGKENKKTYEFFDDLSQIDGLPPMGEEEEKDEKEFDKSPSPPIMSSRFYSPFLYHTPFETIGLDPIIMEDQLSFSSSLASHDQSNSESGSSNGSTSSLYSYWLNHFSQQSDSNSSDGSESSQTSNDRLLHNKVRKRDLNFRKNQNDDDVNRERTPHHNFQTTKTRSGRKRGRKRRKKVKSNSNRIINLAGQKSQSEGNDHKRCSKYHIFSNKQNSSPFHCQALSSKNRWHSKDIKEEEEQFLLFYADYSPQNDVRNEEEESEEEKFVDETLSFLNDEQNKENKEENEEEEEGW